MSDEDVFAKKCHIAHSELLGRHTVATLDIKAGETLLLEKPLLICAFNEECRCASCYKKTETFCQKCQVFPLCNACNDHNEFHCQTLAKGDSSKVVELQKHVRSLGVLQCLLLGANSNTKPSYEKLLQMEAHQEERRNTTIWQEHLQNIVTPLLNSDIANLLSFEINAELLQRFCGILDVNCFEIRAPDEGILRGVYLQAALMPHNCQANCAVAVNDKQELKVYATWDINKNEVIAYCYTNVLFGTAERRESLRQGKYFECNCERCLDPLELGSHMSSLICSNCNNQQREGYVVWQTNINPPKWQCTECNHQLTADNVAKLLERAKEEMFHARDDIYHYEMLLARLSRFLHPYHYVLIDLKQNIAAILRGIINNSAQPPGRKVFERKIRLCQEVLNCLRIVQPGISRLRAITMYELSSTFAELCRMRLNEGEITANDLLSQLQRVEMSFRESLRMLLYEPIESPEGRLARSMLQELKELQSEMNQLQETAAQQ